MKTATLTPAKPPRNRKSIAAGSAISSPKTVRSLYLVGATESAAPNLLLDFSGRVRRDNAVLLASLRQRRDVERRATVNGLTALRNRRWLDDAFPRQLERCARADLPLSLHFADVDHFKHFNDLHGHLNYGEESLLLHGHCPAHRAARAAGIDAQAPEFSARDDWERFVMAIPDGRRRSARLCRLVTHWADEGGSCACRRPAIDHEASGTDVLVRPHRDRKAAGRHFKKSLQGVAPPNESIGPA